MPLDQRYVVAAFDTEGERLAFISSSFEWVTSARQAAIFQSQIDANYFMKSNNLCQVTDPHVQKLPNCDHIRSAYVRVDADADCPEHEASANPNCGLVFDFNGVCG